MNDLVVLVADKDMQFALKGLLDRPRALQIREINYKIVVHTQRDPGCRTNAHDFLRSYQQDFTYALVIFDYDGCGDLREASKIALEVRDNVAVTGRDDRVEVIVIEPELEIWVWSDSSEVERCLGWSESSTDLRTWLVNETYLKSGETKPDNPKEAMEQALRVVRKPRSASIYKQLAESVSLKRCTDKSFEQLVNTLRNWFPAW